MSSSATPAFGASRRVGRVLVLNGGSSAGKTTLGRKLQETLDGSWLVLGIDLLMWMLPPNLMHSADGLVIADGVITRGDEFMRIFAVFRRAIATMASSGIDIVIDEVMLEAAADQVLWDAALAGLDVCWVGVRCDPEIVGAREKTRGDRPPGIAQRQALTVHERVRYDVEVDSGVLSVAQCIDVITDALRARWGMASGAASDAPPQYPTRSALTEDGDISRAPWER